MDLPQWVYSVESFVQRPDEEWLCSICHSVFCNPRMTPCRHIFCTRCIEPWLQTNRSCPVCRSAVSSQNLALTPTLINNVLSKMMVKCSHEGCAETFMMGDARTHIQECPHGKGTCQTCSYEWKIYTDKDHNCIDFLKATIQSLRTDYNRLQYLYSRKFQEQQAANQNSATQSNPENGENSRGAGPSSDSGGEQRSGRRKRIRPNPTPSSDEENAPPHYNLRSRVGSNTEEAQNAEPVPGVQIEDLPLPGASLRQLVAGPILSESDNHTNSDYNVHSDIDTSSDSDVSFGASSSPAGSFRITFRDPSDSDSSYEAFSPSSPVSSVSSVSSVTSVQTDSPLNETNVNSERDSSSDASSSDSD